MTNGDLLIYLIALGLILLNGFFFLRKKVGTWISVITTGVGGAL